MDLKEQSKINTVFQTTYENINSLVDANVVIGKPINVDEKTTIIPISKITVGLLTGGGEYGKHTPFVCKKDLPFSVGNGSIVSIKPYGFLTKEAGRIKLISIEKESFEKILDVAYEIMEKFKEEI